MNKTTTYEDPRKWLPIDPEDIPEPRVVDLTRDQELGFGFVAGSEKPVIVRYAFIATITKLSTVVAVGKFTSALLGSKTALFREMFCNIKVPSSL